MEPLARFDRAFVDAFSSHAFTSALIQNPVSKTITQSLFVCFVVLFWYELLYWSGIYLGLWEYHAKDIFTDVPVHCAHVYVRVNLARQENAEKVRHLYAQKRQSPYSIGHWKTLNREGGSVFELQPFVKYHFEFSPEDFENNPEPELGSTIEHLRGKVVETFCQSSVYTKHYSDQTLAAADVLVFSKTQEVGPENDKTYLSKIHIETGNVVDCIILL